MIAALFVETDGIYFGLPGVDPWDASRDARLYVGPHSVVAHPPCERWGRYWFGGPSVKVRRELGADGGCFEAALNAVRRFGGVLEHPADSKAWPAFGLMLPPHSGGWVAADGFGGWTCCVEQGHYGHRARKATWLYAVGADIPSLKWGDSGKRIRLDAGFHSTAERQRARSRNQASASTERVGTGRNACPVSRPPDRHRAVGHAGTPRTTQPPPHTGGCMTSAHSPRGHYGAPLGSAAPSHPFRVVASATVQSAASLSGPFVGGAL